MNEVLRDAYIDDNQRGVDRWNRMIADAGVSYTITLPEPAVQPDDGDLRRPSLRSRRAIRSRAGSGSAGSTSGSRTRPTGPTSRA